MADTLKVFRNDSGIVINSEASAPQTFNLVTTTASTQAVVKDIAFNIVPSTGSPYSFPLALKLGSSTVATSPTGIGAVFSGSQIVDNSSSLSVDILAETPIMNYGNMSAMLYVSGVSTLITFDINTLAGAISGQGVSIMGKAKRTALSNAIPSGSSGFTIQKNGVTYYVTVGGGNPSNLNIHAADGSLFHQIYLGEHCNWGCEDGGFMYIKPQAAGYYMKKINIATWAVSDLNTSYMAAMATSNPGFLDSFNGKIYMRYYGSDSYINILNLSTGTLTSWYAPVDATEHIGALITTNANNQTYIIEYADTQWYVRNIATQSSVSGSQVWPTDPTTTNANTLFNIAPGIVMVLNSSYSSSCIIDANPATPTITLSTSIIGSTASTGYPVISTPFKAVAYTAFPRQATCSLVASGVSIT